MSIWQTAQHRPSPWGVRYFDTIAAGGGNVGDVLDLAYSDVYGEYLGALSLVLLLTASRPTVDYHPVSRAKLNRARARRREPQLLDHTQVVMHVNDHRLGPGAPRAPLGHARKSPRIHLVSRYLARRGTRHWLVEPYVRGGGTPIERHVHVRR